MIDPFTGLVPLIEPATPRRRERGQIILLFAGAMVVILGMAGLLIDGGFLLSAQRQAQAAADTGALAAAKAASTGGNASSAARTLAATNGYPANLVDCDGSTQANQGVVVNIPPLDGMYAGEPSYVEVITSRAERTLFAPALGMPCFVVRARAVAFVPNSSNPTCSFCALGNTGGDDRYTLLLNGGNDLRVDGEIFSNHATWYTGSPATVRCGANSCSSSNCGDWNGLPSAQVVRMCGHSIYVQHNSGSTTSTLSAHTISMAGGWEAQRYTDIVHADELATDCPAHPMYLGYPPALQETNVCIGAQVMVDPLNDPANPSRIMPTPDYDALSTCSGPPYCGPTASSCTAEPGTQGVKPAPGTFASPSQVTINSGNWTICPGIYYGGFSTNGDAANQPHTVMVPGTYVMVGGGFSVTGTASITSVSSQGDGVTIYNTGGREAFSENFPTDPSLIPSGCPPPDPSLCSATGNEVLNPPGNPVQIGAAVQYKLTLTKATGLPVPTGAASSFTFYNGVTPIACEGGVVVSSNAASLIATCWTRYNTYAGNKGITAVYAGDAVYAPTGDWKTQVVNPPPQTGLDNVELFTTDLSSSCAPCAVIQLHAPTSGTYRGLLIFQDRAIGFLQGAQGVRLQPKYGATDASGMPLACTGNWMTAGVPPDTGDPPEPCGALGGLSGTIYAAHLDTGLSGDWDAVVNIMASGSAYLQIIAAQIDFTQADQQARFTIDPNLLATGEVIRLVE